MGSNKQRMTRILMLPWLAHGHISPFLELAKRLVTRNFHIYICSTAINLTSIEKKKNNSKLFSYQNCAEDSCSIQLVELQLPPTPELPPHYHTTNGLPPHLMMPLKEAYEMSAPRFADIVTDLKPDLVIYDFNQPWAAEIASSQDIPAVEFVTTGAAVLAFALHLLKNVPRGEKEFPFPEMRLREYGLKKLRGQRDADGEVPINDLKDASRFLQALERSHKILMVKSCEEIEGKYFDFVSSLLGKKVVPVGTLVQDPTDGDGDDPLENEIIIKWLDEKEERSVVFVSFGSEYFLTGEERHKIARGLEMSGVSFVWVVRFPNGENMSIREALPEGFLERTSQSGKVVEGWAPQAKILRHPSIGGFVSHCGWSSVMESMKFGVPIVAMPMHIDQPLNAKLVDAVGVGLEAVRDPENGELRSEEIARTIRKVVVDESGEEVRRKAGEMSRKLTGKGDQEIDSLVKELLELIHG